MVERARAGKSLSRNRGRKADSAPSLIDTAVTAAFEALDSNPEVDLPSLAETQVHAPNEEASPSDENSDAASVVPAIAPQPDAAVEMPGSLGIFQTAPAGQLPPAQVEPSEELIPARRLNEFVYCPRLFYYEHVEGVFVENADTLRGGAIHSRVDQGSGAMPSSAVAKGEEEQAEAKPETIHSRSVSCGSERLGVIAKMDLVESRLVEDADAGDLFARRVVCPVDYKAGSPREGADGNELWDTDKMQLGLQCLILRDNGYLCDEGIIYYRGTKQRVPLPVTPELEAWVLEKITAARETMKGSIPAPLVDSPKCPRCSLVTVCLPDETRLLAEGLAAEREQFAARGGDSRRAGTHAPPRRLIASRDVTKPLYLNTPGLYVGRSGDVLQVKDKKELVQEVRINDLSHVALFGNIQMSTQAVQNLCEKEIPVTYFSMGGWFYGITRGHGLTNVFLRMEQFRQAALPEVCLDLARRIVSGKIRNQRTMLMRNHLQLPAPIPMKLKFSAETAEKAGSVETLLGVEGAAAAFYFQEFGGMIKSADEPAAPSASENGQISFNFDFKGRNRRPPADPINAMLSLAYSLLAKDCTIAALAVGFDPYVGFYHQPRFGRPALALDLMEEFRPLIAESAVLTAINNRILTKKDFVSAGRAVNLSPSGRRQFYEVYEQRMNHLINHPVFDYKVSYRRAIELQFRLLSRVLTGEIPTYVPFMTR